MLGICTHVNKYLDLKYKYKYKYPSLKYEYKYKYSKHVLEHNLSTTTSTKYTSLLEKLTRNTHYTPGSIGAA